MSVKVNVTGRLGGDAESRYTSNGKMVVNFSLATNTYENGQKETHWIRVSYFGSRAENVLDWLKKGTVVAVEGRLQIPKIFTRKDGTVGVNTELVANDVELHGGQVEEVAEETINTEPDEEDEIPF